MKTICEKTGITLLQSSGLAKWTIAAEHPIFSMKLEPLLQIAATEWSPALAEQDKKLLLLAIAHNCELLDWEKRDSQQPTPAMPTLSTVESSIRNLLKIAGWIDAERYADRTVHYPCYLISSETCYMKTFPDMLHSIIETRHLSKAAERREHRLKFLENAAVNLSAKCRIGAKGKEGALLRVTAEWAMQVCSKELARERVDNSIKEDWLKMLQTSPAKLKASNFSINDVHELRDFMLEYLPHGSVIAHDVIAHLNALVDCNVINDVDQGDVLKARILMDANLNSSEAGEAAEPQRNQFPDLLSYARAKAQWQLQRIRQEAAADEALKKAAAEARAKINNRTLNPDDEI